ncbi:hypothetical protein [Yokenella regensburgei]|uniref:hypothetical protein n=1 Tax=Yokenella regensburgei TaxID=158877 RepID=UPI00137574EF|nr:hypothetical protein [Yokenella regensburgei]KAF1366306.1 hypothetical protein FHR25_005232 [Yokenella regensburgei]
MAVLGIVDRLVQHYRYVVAEDGLPPEWDEAHTATYCNPVSVGDFIRHGKAEDGLRKVVRIVHYAEGAVLFTVSGRSVR